MLVTSVMTSYFLSWADNNGPKVWQKIGDDPFCWLRVLVMHGFYGVISFFFNKFFLRIKVKAIYDDSDENYFQW